MFSSVKIAIPMYLILLSLQHVWFHDRQQEKLDSMTLRWK